MTTPLAPSTGAPAGSHRPSDRGASAVEYALLVSGIAAVIVVVVLLLGGKVQTLFSGTCSAYVGSGTCDS